MRTLFLSLFKCRGTLTKLTYNDCVMNLSDRFATFARIKILMLPFTYLATLILFVNH